MKTVQVGEENRVESIGARIQGRRVDFETAPWGEERAEVGEILLPIDDSKDSERAVDHAIGLARRLAARILMVYVARRIDIPNEIREFAQVEKVKDIQGMFFDWIGRETLQRLGKMVEAAGVQYRSTTYIGTMNEAVDTYCSGPTVFMTVLPLKHMKSSGLLSFGVSRMVDLKVPTLVIPSSHSSSRTLRESVER